MHLSLQTMFDLSVKYDLIAFIIQKGTRLCKGNFQFEKFIESKCQFYQINFVVSNIFTQNIFNKI